jgi:L-2,4-diaminobutyrate decarboxylase
MQPDGAGPRSAHTPSELRKSVESIEVCPEEGQPVAAALKGMRTSVWGNGVDTTHRACAAHLQPPPLLAATAAELATAVTNQSLDSWDQAPAATFLELHLLTWLAKEFGLPRTASGVFTAGGTASNLLGLTVARSRAAARLAYDVLANGLPGEAASWRVVTSDQAHFSIQRAASLLGLGRSSIVAVSTDSVGRMDVAALDTALEELAAERTTPIAIVATAGTTDHGAIDPIPAIAERASAVDAWLHVDAAVGGAFVLSENLKPLLAGIERADSVTVDFHKLWWQPFSASAVLMRDVADLKALRIASAYLDHDDEPYDVVNLVGRSLDTSRPFSAAKVVASLHAVGRQAMGEMLDHLFTLARAAATAVDADPTLELIAVPTTITCLFRCATKNPREHEILRVAQQNLLQRGEAIVGRTRSGGRSALKLTFINPMTTEPEVRNLVQTIAAEIERVVSG